MEEWGTGRRVATSLRGAVGLGWLGGCLEVLALQGATRQPLNAVEVFTLSAINGILVAVVAVVLALILSPVLRFGKTAPAVAGHLALVVGLLLALALGPNIPTLLAQERMASAGMMAVLIPTSAIAVFLNGRYWVGRATFGAAPKGGWLGIALIGSLVVSGLSVAAASTRGAGGGFALEGDPSVVLITTEGLPHGDLPASVEELRRASIRFPVATVGSPSAAAGAASIMTGLHPARHRVLDDAGWLSPGFSSLPRVLAEEGYATAAFVGSPALDRHTGFDRHFGMYDRAIGPIPALDELGLPQLLRVFGPMAPWMGGDDGVVLDRFLAWMPAQEMPYFAWVHLTQADMVGDSVQRLVDGLKDADQYNSTWIAFSGARGICDPRLSGLTDASVRVPLSVRIPGVRATVREVPVQVRPMDLPVTLLAALKLPDLGKVEGEDLARFWTGTHTKGLWTPLVGWNGQLALDGPVLGLRTDEIKVVGEPAEVFDLASDPGEMTDIAASQRELLAQVSRLLTEERRALEEELPNQPAPTRWNETRLREWNTACVATP